MNVGIRWLAPTNSYNKLFSYKSNLLNNVLTILSARHLNNLNSKGSYDNIPQNFANPTDKFVIHRGAIGCQYTKEFRQSNTTIKNTNLSHIPFTLNHPAFSFQPQIFKKLAENMAPISIKDEIKYLIDNNKVMLFAKSYCPYCHKVEAYLKDNQIPFKQLDLDTNEHGKEIQDKLYEMTKQKTVPNLFINRHHVGGCDDFFAVVKAKKLDSLLQGNTPKNADTNENNNDEESSKMSVKDSVKLNIDTNRVMVFAKSFCPYCHKVEKYLKEHEIPFRQLDIDLLDNGKEIQETLQDLTGQRTVPNIFINGTHVGGCDNFFNVVEKGNLQSMLDKKGPVKFAATEISQESSSSGNNDTSNNKNNDNNNNNSNQPGMSVQNQVKHDIDTNKVMLFAKSYCPYCHKVESYLKDHEIPFKQLDLDLIDDGKDIQDALRELTGQKTVPNLFINGTHVGGSDDFFKLVGQDKLAPLLEGGKKGMASVGLVDKADEEEKEDTNKYDYDLISVGGGSGGLSCSKYAADFGAKVAVFDFIVPTPIGTTWGLGGTCVNVGCVPKKLMHRAALSNDFIYDAVRYGWEFPTDSKFKGINATADEDNLMLKPQSDMDRHDENKNKDELSGTLNVDSGPNKRKKDTVDKKGVPVTFTNPERKHTWGTLVEGVQNHIHKLNFGAKAKLREKGVKYYNCYAAFEDPHTLVAKEKNGKEFKVTGKYILIASGVRPHYLDIPGAKEYCITSDDIFSLKYPPGKTLCVGASYIALECAGFLHGLGFQTTVMVRSILLRHFDQQIAEMIGKYMAAHGVTFIRPAIPYKIEKLEDGEPPRLKVHYKLTKPDGSEEDCSEEFNTVLLAIGREARTKDLDIDKAGVKLNPKNHKILVNDRDQSNVPHIYALGDNADGRQELTPVAVASGHLLAARLFNKSKELCDYDNVPTTVFTPNEYGCIGLSEEAAIEKYGKDNIEVYHTFFRPLEWTIPDRESNACYGKLVVNKADKERVVGFHYLGPNAGEITQGYAVAVKLNATKADFDRTIAIHPTQSETFIGMTTKKSATTEAAEGGC